MGYSVESSPRHAGDAHALTHVAHNKRFGLTQLFLERTGDVLAFKFIAHAQPAVAHADNLGAPHKLLRIATKEQQPRNGRDQIIGFRPALARRDDLFRVGNTAARQERLTRSLVRRQLHVFQIVFDHAFV